MRSMRMIRDKNFYKLQTIVNDPNFIKKVRKTTGGIPGTPWTYGSASRNIMKTNQDIPKVEGHSSLFITKLAPTRQMPN